MCEFRVRALLKNVMHNRFKLMHITTSTYNMFATVKLCSKSIRNYLKKVGDTKPPSVSNRYLSKKKIRKQKQWGLNHTKWTTA